VENLGCISTPALSNGWMGISLGASDVQGSRCPSSSAMEAVLGVPQSARARHRVGRFAEPVDWRRMLLLVPDLVAREVALWLAADELAILGNADGPAWSPDGRRVIFSLVSDESC
jgi:hypothetical protein